MKQTAYTDLVFQMVYNLKAVLEDGRCSKLPTLIESEPVMDSKTLPKSLKIQIMSSKLDYDAHIARQIKEHFLAKFEAKGKGTHLNGLRVVFLSDGA